LIPESIVARQRAARRGPARDRAADPLDEPEKRRAILHAAVRVFADKGYHGCRIADVARQAGVAYGLVYHYFRNKEALLEKVFEEQWAIFIAAIRAIREGPGSAAERLAGVCRFAVDVLRTAPAAVRVLMLEVARTPNSLRAGTTRQTFEEAVRLVSEIVREGQERGEIRARLDPLVAAAGLLGALERSLTVLVLGLLPSDSDVEVERAKEQVVDFVLGGVTGGRRPS
jgi:TetR/AcrR family transcriptional regulator, fatty acid metabolism regulator protein